MAQTALPEPLAVAAVREDHHVVPAQIEAAYRSDWLMRKIVECTDVLNRSVPRLRKHEYSADDNYWNAVVASIRQCLDQGNLADSIGGVATVQTLEEEAA